MSGEGFIRSITRILLEDAGLSADGVPANSAGAGQVDGIGIGPRGEPGGVAHRKRKRDALKSRADRKLHKALTAEGHVELDLMDLSDAGLWRFNEGNKDGAIDAEPTLPNSSDEIDPNPKKKTKMPSKRSLRRGDGEILLNPVIPTRFEDVVAEDLPGGTPRIDMLIRLGLGDMKKIWYYRNAIKDPPTANKNPTLRPFVAEMLEKLVDMIFRDQVLYNRVRALLTKSDHTRGENELPEDTDDEKELARFARWKTSRICR
jgi:hypothetical protein